MINEYVIKLIENLPVGVQQKVEILRALIYDAKVLILDEPTAVLTPQETDELLSIMKSLKSKGAAIIFITHKLREVQEVADKITVIRRGKVVGTTLPTATQEELANLMVGRTVDLTANRESNKAGDTVLGMSLDHGGHLTHGHPMSFSGIDYKFVSYGVNSVTEQIDYDELDGFVWKNRVVDRDIEIEDKSDGEFKTFIWSNW